MHISATWQIRWNDMWGSQWRHVAALTSKSLLQAGCLTVHPTPVSKHWTKPKALTSTRKNHPMTKSFLDSRTYSSSLGKALLPLRQLWGQCPSENTNENTNYATTADSAANNSSSVGCQRDATSICCWAPAPAARRTQLSIDISRPQSTRQQTRRLPLLLSIDGTDRQTLDRYIDPAQHNMWTGWTVLKKQNISE